MLRDIGTMGSLSSSATPEDHGADMSINDRPAVRVEEADRPWGMADLIEHKLKVAARWDRLHFGVVRSMQRHKEWYEKHVKPLHGRMGVKGAKHA